MKQCIYLIIFLFVAANLYASFPDVYDMKVLTADFAFMEISGNNVYTCSLDGRIYKSVDKGMNWNPCIAEPSMSSPTTSCFGIVAYENTVMICNQNLLLCSSDSGNTWDSIRYDSPYSFMYINLLDSQTGIAICSTGLVHKTIDAGKSWLRINSGFADSIVCSIVSSTKKILSANKSGRIFCSTDTGSTWKEIASNYSDFVPQNFSCTKDGAIYLLADSLLLKSTDDGETWDSIIRPSIGFNYCYYMKNGHGYFVGDTSVIITEQDTIYKEIPMKPYGLVTTTAKKDLVAIKFFDDSCGVVIGANNNILRTVDAGESWELISCLNAYTTIGFTGIDFINDSVGYIGSYREKLYKTTDYGNTWHPVTSEVDNSNSTGVIRYINLLDENTAIMISGGRYTTTKDGGYSVIKHSLSDVGKFDPHFLMISDSLVLMSGVYVDSPQWYCFYELRDFNGNYYNRTFINEYFLSTKVISPNKIFLNGFIQDSTHLPDLPEYWWRGVIMMSQDTCKTWEYQYFDNVEEIKGISFYDDSLGYAIARPKGYTKSLIYRTTDGGFNWELMDSTVGRMKSTFTFTKQGIGIEVYRNCIYYSTDKGVTWELGTTLMDNFAVNDYKITDNYIYLTGKYASYYPTLIRLKLKDSWTGVEETHIESPPTTQFLIFRPYPNPASNAVSIDIIWSNSCDYKKMKVDIYNVYGEKIVEPKIEFSQKSSNTGTFTWQSSQAETGVYLIEVGYNGTTKIQKVAIY